jgi:hypothetical protein
VRALVTDYHLVFGYYLSGVALALLPATPVLGLAVAMVLRRAGWVTRAVAGGLAAWTAAVLLLTLTPGRLSYHPGVCAFIWSGTAGDLGSTDAKILNILIFVPIGLLAAALVRRSWLPMAGVFLLSPAIELTQREFPSINRSCDLVDVIDNVGGTVAGATIGLLLVWVVASFPSGRPPTNRSAPGSGGQHPPTPGAVPVGRET